MNTSTPADGDAIRRVCEFPPNHPDRLEALVQLAKKGIYLAVVPLQPVAQPRHTESLKGLVIHMTDTAAYRKHAKRRASPHWADLIADPYGKAFEVWEQPGFIKKFRNWTRQQKLPSRHFTFGL